MFFHTVETLLALLLFQLCAGVPQEVLQTSSVVQETELTVKVLKTSNGKLLTVDDSGKVMAFGDLDDPQICFILRLPELGRVQFESKAHPGRFLGVTEDGQIAANQEDSGDYQEFKFLAMGFTELEVARDDKVCKFSFAENGTAVPNACEDNETADVFNVIPFQC